MDLFDGIRVKLMVRVRIMIFLAINVSFSPIWFIIISGEQTSSDFKVTI